MSAPSWRTTANGTARAAQRLRHAQRARAARGVVGGGRRRGVRRVARAQAQPLLLPPRDRLLPHALRGLGRAVLPGGVLEHLAAGGGARAGHDVPLPRPRGRRGLERVVRSLRAGRRPGAPRWLWAPSAPPRFACRPFTRARAPTQGRRSRPTSRATTRASSTCAGARQTAAARRSSATGLWRSCSTTPQP